MVRKAAETWPGAEISIEDSFGNDIASVPSQFLNAINLTCAYLTYIAETLVYEPGIILKDGTPCHSDDKILGALYIWQTDQPRTFRSGPEGKSSAKPLALHNIDGDESTWSKSSRSSSVQNMFRFESIARDGQCLLTFSTDLEAIQGCHIVPKSRGDDLVKAICGGKLARRIDSVQNALSLRADVHHQFDKYQFGIYTKDGNFSIHVFTSRDLLQYHGKPLGLRDGPGFTPRYPDPRLLEWHYRQCVMSRFRID